MAKKTNPNGANQHLVDPRQSLFLSHYLDPESLTFSNALQSALKAGYEQEYAESITAKMPSWLAEAVGSMGLVRKAERNLEEFLDVDIHQPAMGPFGPIMQKVGQDKVKTVTLKNGKKVQKKIPAKKVPVMVRNSKIMGLKLDASKFVAERLGRKKYGKDEQESPLNPTVNNFTQIIINPPNGRKNAGSQSNGEAVSSVAGS